MEEEEEEGEEGRQGALCEIKAPKPGTGGGAEPPAAARITLQPWQSRALYKPPFHWGKEKRRDSS